MVSSRIRLRVQDQWPVANHVQNGFKRLAQNLEESHARVL